MAQSRPLLSGMAGHTETRAVADVAQEYGAEGLSLGPMGTRPCDREHRVRKRPSTATPLRCVSEAGPCGDGLSRSLPTQGDDGWGVAPSRIPQQSGARVNPHRRDAVPLARLARAGDLPLVSVPQGADAALRACLLRQERRALPRAREDPLSALKAATVHLPYADRATGGPTPRRWRSAGVCPTAAQHIGCPADVRAIPASPNRLPRLAQALPAPGHRGRLPPVGAARQALRSG
jgi:hypothetical protein